MKITPITMPATKEQIRKFVRDMGEMSERVKEARDALNQAVKDNDEMQRIDDDMKSLREEKKELLKTHPILSTFVSELEELKDEQKQIIADAKQDGVPKGEIDLAIKALKKDIDMTISTEIYTNIADLVD